MIIRGQYIFHLGLEMNKLKNLWHEFLNYDLGPKAVINMS